VVGIIGRNGAGKSTLLKILSRITKPTGGHVTLNGRVGSLLEVGTGFHPELTGRENIFLNGSILGMSHSEITKQFDAIVDFSGVEQFLDTPVKRYSSGMYVRLAFAVAAHLEPEILIVDEVLAVGDADFQKKCLGKMSEVVRLGRTILFVSHNMAAISQLCRTAIWLDRGSLKGYDITSEVVDDYISQRTTTNTKWNHIRTPNCGREIELHSVELLGVNNNLIQTIDFDKPCKIAIGYLATSPIVGLSLLVRISDNRDNVVFTSWDTDRPDNGKVPWNTETVLSVCHLPVGVLRPGRYTVSVGARSHGLGMIDYHDNVIAFDVSPAGFPMNSDRVGIITPALKWAQSTL
jgi:lipopolysaccharide transport system ATP-binding protein